jgi:hypothetical protein
MGGNMFKRGTSSMTLWRPVLGLLLAYAVAAQSLLIAIGGFTLPAQAEGNAPAFELCLHDAQDAPNIPADHSGHSGCTHCIFCFAGAHHALIGSPPVVFHRAAIVIARTDRSADKHSLPHLSAYSIANPRAPPPRA